MTLHQKIMMAILIFAIGWPLALLLDRRQPVVLLGGRIEPEAAGTGDTIHIVWRIEERRKGCDGELRRVIYDSAGKVHEFLLERTVYHELMTPNADRFSKPIILPNGLTPGPAIYTSHIWRWCNFMQRHFWPIYSRGSLVPFTILPSPSAKGETGEKGDTGERGQRGEKGDTGKSGIP